mgnify:CR=1 FL=1
MSSFFFLARQQFLRQRGIYSELYIVLKMSSVQVGLLHAHTLSLSFVCVFVCVFVCLFELLMTD